MNPEQLPQNPKRRKLLKAVIGVSAVTLAGAIYWPNRWKYIVIHHSAGSFGNIEFLQKVHRQRQSADPIDAIPYHFIIGNGNGMAMGEIASDWRKQNNLWGAHVSSRNSDRNFRGLGICLIGNFEENEVPEEQYQALKNLVTNLMKKYSISINDISGHGLTKGEMTLCPGQYFPIKRLLNEVNV